jgi:iron complex transport system substrate-binding protein
MRLFLLLAVFADGILAFPAGAQVTVTDDLQRGVTLPGTPERIVSLAPSITETLFAIGAGDQVAGVTDYCNYPKEVTGKLRVGGMINPSIETIVSLRPDLILLSMEGNVRDDFRKLTGLGIPVFVTNPRTLQGIYKSIADLGTLTGRTEESARVLASMQSRERRVRAPMKARIERSVLLIVSLQPLMVAGSGTFLSEILTLAGGRNIAGSSSSTYPQFSREAVVEGDPEVLLILSDAGGGSQNLTDRYPEWRHLRAVRNGRVYYVDPDILSRPGPRAADGLERVALLLNPKP